LAPVRGGTVAIRRAAHDVFAALVDAQALPLYGLSAAITLCRDPEPYFLLLNRGLGTPSSRESALEHLNRCLGKCAEQPIALRCSSEMS